MTYFFLGAIAFSTMFIDTQTTVGVVGIAVVFQLGEIYGRVM